MSGLEREPEVTENWPKNLDQARLRREIIFNFDTLHCWRKRGWKWPTGAVSKEEQYYQNELGRDKNCLGAKLSISRSGQISKWDREGYRVCFI
jgi:hypothetical protein